MARIRYLKPEFFTDEDLAELPFETRLAYAGLWCYADKRGRLEYRPKYLKAMIFPYDDIDMEKQLRLLATPKRSNSEPFIQIYEVNGHRYIQILKWEKHQKPHHTEADSKIPALSEGVIYTNILDINKEEINKNKIKGNGKGNGKLTQSDSEVKETLNNGSLTVNEPLDKKQMVLISDIVKPKKKQASQSDELMVRFERFWSAYPKKKNKGDAEKAWRKIKPSEELLEIMLAKIEEGKNSWDWTKEDGQFIPYPATWLNRKGWEDVFEPIKTPTWLKGAEMWLKMEEERERNEERGQEEVVELDDKGEGRFALPDRVKT